MSFCNQEEQMDYECHTSTGNLLRFKELIAFCPYQIMVEVTLLITYHSKCSQAEASLNSVCLGNHWLSWFNIKNKTKHLNSKASEITLPAML